MGLFGHDVELAYDTEELEQCMEEFAQEAADIRELIQKMKSCIDVLVNEGWTTNAGKAFQTLTENGWEDNMEKYAGAMDALSSALKMSSTLYNELTTDYIQKLEIQ